MSDKKHFDELHKVAETNKIETQDDVSPADLALTLLLHDPELLERAHAEVSLLKPKKQFMYFMSKKKAPDEFAVPEQKVLAALEKEMADWFSKKTWKFLQYFTREG